MGVFHPAYGVVELFLPRLVVFLHIFGMLSLYISTTFGLILNIIFLRGPIAHVASPRIFSPTVLPALFSFLLAGDSNFKTFFRSRGANKETVPQTGGDRDG
ncbi:hypothetical protein SDC9_122517 [bioreactor metagenome]|uniref:Uncharacterized protein n=1 Tax=bioreactor metagenome TaxID=1076179 RepID=A0A645CF27_9ZZZZ